MSISQTKYLVDYALAFQVDRSRTWFPAWRDLVEAVYTARQLPDEKWNQYILGLTSNAQSSIPAARDSALKGLLYHLKARDLSTSQIDSLMDYALILQGDRTKPWTPAWGDLVEAAHAIGCLPEVKFKQYARQAYAYHLAVRPLVRRGDPLPFCISIDAPRYGSGQPVFLTQVKPVLRSTNFASDNYALEISSSGYGSGSIISSIPFDPDKLANLPDGLHTLKLTVEAKVGLMRSFGFSGYGFTAMSTDLEGTFQLVPANEPTVAPVNDNSMQARVEQSLKVLWLRRSGGPNQIEGIVRISNAPADFAFDMILRAKGREWTVGTIAVKKGYQGDLGTAGEAVGLTNDVVDVIFRPDIDVARQSVELTSFWNGEVVFHDVEVISISRVWP